MAVTAVLAPYKEQVMLIKLVIIVVISLGNGMAKEVREDIVGYNSLEDCTASRDMVEEYFKNYEGNDKKLLLAECLYEGKI